MNEKLWFNWAIELQSLAQSGLTYGKDIYDRERYERAREISTESIAHKSEIPVETVKDLFCNETGYQPPKPDTRQPFLKTIKSCWCGNITENCRFTAVG